MALRAALSQYCFENMQTPHVCRDWSITQGGHSNYDLHSTKRHGCRETLQRTFRVQNKNELLQRLGWCIGVGGDMPATYRAKRSEPVQLVAAKAGGLDTHPPGW